MPKRYTRPIPQLNRDQIERFLSKVIIGDDYECWPWTGSVNEYGYGGVRINRDLFKATRIMYTLEYKEDPSDLNVCHHCDNPPCMNPAHYWLGTMKENSDDSANKGRSKILYLSGDRNPARLHPELHIRGQDTYNAKLTNEKVIEIRRRSASGSRSYDLAHEFGVAQSHICDIVARRRWKHIN